MLVTGGVPEGVAGVMVTVAELLPWFVALMVALGTAKVIYRVFRRPPV